MKKPTRAVSAPSSLLFILISANLTLAMTGNDPSIPREIRITAGRFGFTPNSIGARKGERLKLTIISVEADRGFDIRDFGVAVKVKSGATETIEFTPDKEGKFTFSCSDVNGDGQTEMVGELTVSGESRTSTTSMKVTFDPNAPGVVYVETNGERVRIDTNSKDFARVDDVVTSEEKTDPQTLSGGKKRGEIQSRW
jgi:cytochrome c oxidase subunit II